MLIVGGGPIACELGQAFQRLGTQVQIVQRNKTILPREDTDISDILHQQMVADGV
jgi:pyruvate/2-oxoglutarate dehydrogenase complex dihydrolipoamide dehydrogenase (E3) component